MKRKCSKFVIALFAILVFGGALYGTNYNVRAVGIISSESIEKAISFAYDKKNTVPYNYNDRCAAFVWQAYNYGAGIGNPSFATARQMGDALISHTDSNPPRGALVFWHDSNGPLTLAGHVGLSLGNGTVIHAYPNLVVSKITTVNNSHFTYRGWGAPIAGYELATYTPVYTEAPSNPKLNVSSNKVAVGEQITFNYSINNAEHIYIPIDVNGVREHFIEVYGNSYSISFSKPGTYCAALFASNAVGESGFSEWVTFEVYDKAPNNPKLSVSSNKVAVGESITFNYSVDNATSIYIPIDVDGVREHYIEVSGNSYTTSFSKPGIYCAALFARNTLGESGFSEWVTFEVSADAPSNPKLAIYTNKVHTGQNILFEYSVENATNMYIAIDVDGIREHYIEVSGDHYNASFTKPGIYHAALFARNANGESGFSNWVCFEVYNEGPTNCTIESNKSVYNAKEDVVLDFEANHGENYELKIYKDDIHILSYWVEDGKNNDYVVNFEQDGIYKIYVVAYNYYYHASSAPIYIIVGKYSILYNSDTDENNPSYQTKIYNDSIKLSDLIPSKQGYKFKEWNTCFDGSGVSYNPGDTYTENKNLVLYAQWEKAVPYTESITAKSDANYIIKTNLYNIPNGAVIISGYKNGKQIDIKTTEYNSDTITTELKGDIDEIIVMVWDSLKTMRPLCRSEIITKEQFVTE